MLCHTLKSHLKSLGLDKAYITLQGVLSELINEDGLDPGGAYKPNKKNVLDRWDKTNLRNELKKHTDYIIGHVPMR